MRLNESIGAVLSAKGLGALTIHPEATVYEAIRLMAEHDVGALLVISDNELLGVLSERDYARKSPSRAATRRRRWCASCSTASRPPSPRATTWRTACGS